jgi:hypothetical protein
MKRRAGGDDLMGLGIEISSPGMTTPPADHQETDARQPIFAGQWR